MKHVDVKSFLIGVLFTLLVFVSIGADEGEPTDGNLGDIVVNSITIKDDGHGGFDKYVNLDSDVSFLGKDKLIKIKSEGINRKLMGLFIDAKKISMTKSLDVKDQDNSIVGELRSACFSPHFNKVIGIAMIKKPFCIPSQNVKVDINGVICNGKVCDLPFI